MVDDTERKPPSQLSGEELDQAVATEILRAPFEDPSDVPVISESPGYLWRMVERLGLVVFPLDDRWYAGTVDFLGGPYAIYVEGGLSSGATAAEAICRAALVQARSDR